MLFTSRIIRRDKFVVVDDETVETGRFNFTASAERRIPRTLSCGITVR